MIPETLCFCEKICAFGIGRQSNGRVAAAWRKRYGCERTVSRDGSFFFRNTQELIEQLQGWLVEQHAQKNKNQTVDGFQQILKIYEGLNGGLNNAASS